MVNKGNSLSTTRVLPACVPASLHAGAASDSGAEPRQAQTRTRNANPHRRRVKGWFVRPVDSPSDFPQALPHKARPRAEIEISPSLMRRRLALVSHPATRCRVQPPRVGSVRQQSCRWARRPSASGTTKLRPRSLSYSSLTLCCVAPCLGWQRGHAAPCGIVREGDAMVIAEHDMSLYVANACVLEGYKKWLRRRGRAGSRPPLPATSRIGSMLS
jgi:hypothetical protein